MALSLSDKIEFWDAAFEAIRKYMRHSGLREVTTSQLRNEVALEPYIEPIGFGGRWLQTSPELAMKDLLIRGAPAIFQIAHVFRAGEVGIRHREEFHLIEWYRRCAELNEVVVDVEQLVSQIAARIPLQRGEITRNAVSWHTWKFCGLFEHLTGISLEAGLSAGELTERLADSPLAIVGPWHSLNSSDAADLLAWTELFSTWSDTYLDPWLRQLPLTQGVHLIEFPCSLAALSRTKGATAMRFESYWRGNEIANGYLELQDPIEQRRRFVAVQAIRALHGNGVIDVPAQFLSALDSPGLPDCVGCAMGLERVLMSILGCEAIADIAN